MKAVKKTTKAFKKTSVKAVVAKVTKKKVAPATKTKKVKVVVKQKVKAPKVKLPVWTIKSYNPNDRHTSKLPYLREEDARKMSSYLAEINVAHTLHDVAGVKVDEFVNA